MKQRAWYVRASMPKPPAAGLVCGLLACGPLACGPQSAPRPKPTIDLFDCGAGIADLECGKLEVEENRDAPNGRTVTLQIAVARSTSRTPESDPVFLLAGGPGQGAAAIAPMILHKFDAIRSERDLVFVDVRGTGKSDALACEVEDPEDLEEVLGATLDLSGLADCLAAYDEDLDLRQYTSAAMADDLDEVRAALGYDQVNLMAISYGTALAQVWVRRHGEHIRSVVFDGAVPVDLEILHQMPANAEHALARVLADCREDKQCGARYPGLERKLAQVLVDLETNRKLEEFAHPRSGERVRVDITREGFVQVIHAVLYSDNTTALLPLLIESAYAGEYGPIAAMALRKAWLSKTLSMGLYLSVACAEQLDRPKRSSLQGESSRRPAVTGLEVFDDHALAQLQQACARWPHAELPNAEFEPVHSGVPTLLLSGRYDPVTPAEFGAHLTASFTNSRHVVVEQASHGVWHFGCAPDLIANFFATADPAAVDPSCFDMLTRSPVFLTPNGPLPLPPSDQPSGGGEHPHANELAQGELVERD
jgi:pimeloyl-ACP methyl ester carboxylesterase